MASNKDRATLAVDLAGTVLTAAVTPEFKLPKLILDISMVLIKSAINKNDEEPKSVKELEKVKQEEVKELNKLQSQQNQLSNKISNRDNEVKKIRGYLDHLKTAPITASNPKVKTKQDWANEASRYLNLSQKLGFVDVQQLLSYRLDGINSSLSLDPSQLKTYQTKIDLQKKEVENAENALHEGQAKEALLKMPNITSRLETLINTVETKIISKLKVEPKPDPVKNVQKKSEQSTEDAAKTINVYLSAEDLGINNETSFTKLTSVINDLIASIKDLIAKITPGVAETNNTVNKSIANPAVDVISETDATTGDKGDNKETEGNKTWGNAWKQNFNNMTDEMLTWSQQMRQITDQTAQSMQQTMNSFFFDAFTGKLKNLGDYVNGFLSSVQQSIANALAQKFTNQLINWIFPGMASGGPVDSDRPYIVGERGPELFVPSVAGAIIPNHRLNGASANGNTQGTANGGSNVTVNVINQSGTAVEAKQGQAKVTPDGIIIPVILKALETNQMGLRDVLTAAR